MGLSTNSGIFSNFFTLFKIVKEPASFSGSSYVREVIRTPDLPLRRRSLYPSELRRLIYNCQSGTKSSKGLMIAGHFFSPAALCLPLTAAIFPVPDLFYPTPFFQSCQRVIYQIPRVPGAIQLRGNGVPFPEFRAGWLHLCKGQRRYGCNKCPSQAPFPS